MGILELEQQQQQTQPTNTDTSAASVVGPTVTITGEVSNLTPGKHGISICEAGDLSFMANSCGKIFNPFGKTHGAPQDLDQRMVGDLGNILADESGRAMIDITDRIIRLIGPHSIIGRSIVIYSGEDDQGRGGYENSLTTGNAGPRVAAGVIGIKLPTP